MTYVCVVSSLKSERCRRTARCRKRYGGLRRPATGWRRRARAWIRRRLLVAAAHAWDVAAAFVARPGMVLDLLAPEPLIVATDLEGVAAALLKQAS